MYEPENKDKENQNNIIEPEENNTPVKNTVSSTEPIQDTALSEDAVSSQSEPIETEVTDIQAEPIQSEMSDTQAEPIQSEISDIQEEPIQSEMSDTQAEPIQSEIIARQEETVSENHSVREETQTNSFHMAEDTGCKEHADIGSSKKQCYEEHIKKQCSKKNGWAKLVAGCLIAGVAAGSSIGVGYGAIQHYYEKEKAEVISHSDKPYIQKTVSGEGFSAIDVIKKVKPSVVSISTKIEGAKQAFGNFYVPYEGKGAGSGVIFYQDNEKIAIVTNNHVIEDAKEVFITLENDTTLPAVVVGTKADADLAVLTVSRADMKSAGISEVSVATFGKSGDLEVGSPVIAIGNAMGMGLSATEGILSVAGLDIVTEGQTLHVMQTSAPINSGNSGGPLVNSAGEVIGINTGKYNSSMTEGMGYAIPSDTVLPIAEDLLTDGSSPSPHIGIVGTSITKDDASLYKLPIGTLIIEVTEGGPADKAGIQAGDIITQFNGKSVMDMETLVSLVEKSEVGTSVPVHIIRNGETPIDVTLVIGDKNV